MRAHERALAWLIAGAAVAPLGLGAPAGARAIGATRVFAAVPSPGQPSGIAVGAGRVWVSTAGLITRPASDPAVFGFAKHSGSLRTTITIPRAMPVMAMALFGLAFDAADRLYVVDMNGMIYRIDPATGARETYAEFPASVGGLTVMPTDMAFDRAGNAYVTDQNLAAIWRVPPGGSPEIWFQDPRLASYILGPTGIRLDPGGTHLYFTVASSFHPATPREGLVFRLPLANPSAASLEQVFAYPGGSSPFGIAFGKSGRLYVALASVHQVSILDPVAKAEVLRFPSPEANAGQAVPYDRPWNLALDGRGSLLVTNSAWLSGEERMVVLEAFVDDTPAALARPTIP